MSPDLLYLISFLYQTTTIEIIDRCFDGCILSLSYIKPQPEYYYFLYFRSFPILFASRSGLNCYGSAAKILKKF